ncbi:MAG: tetratricopeptide repeat protein, partial [Opitutaceae bacterium]
DAGEAYRRAAELAPLRSAARIRYIQFRMESGQPAGARKDLAALTRKAPDYIPGWVFAMRLAFSQRRYGECANAIRQILYRDGGNYDALTEQGALKLAQGDAAGAIAKLKDAEGLYPHSPEIMYLLARAYLSANDPARASDRLHAALLLAPHFPQAVVLLADIDLRRGADEDAVSALAALLKTTRYAPAYPLLARGYLAEKNPREALATYREMAEALPKDPEPYFLAGTVQQQLKELPQARKAFERAAAIDPAYGPAQEMLVTLDLKEGKDAAAEDRAGKLIAKYPKAGRPWVFKAEADFADKHAPEAEADLLKAIQIDPNDSRTYLILAHLYLFEHKTDAALARLTALVDRTRSVTAQMQIAAIHSGLGRHDLAAADYRKLLSFAPKNAAALNDLAYEDCQYLGDLKDAYALAKEARAAAPDDPRVADTLGWVLFKRGNYRGALDLFEESAGRVPGDLSVQYHLGMARYMLGEENEARISLARAATDRADPEIALAAKNRIGILDIDPGTATPATRADLEKRARAEPNDPIVLMRLAAIEAKEGSAADAARHFEAARALVPVHAETLSALAQLYAGPLHRPDKARKLAKLAHEMAPNDPAIARTLGELLYATGDYRWSMDLLEQAAQGAPNDPQLQYELARGYYSVGRVPDAQQALAAARADPRFSKERAAARFAALIEAGKSPGTARAAKAQWAAALEADPHSLAALMAAAMAKEAEGDAAGAGILYEKLLAEDPLFAPADRRLARIDLDRPGKEGEAYTLAVKARNAFPNDPEVAETLGILDYRREDYAGAELLLEQCLQDEPNDAEAVYHLGMTHYRLHELAESKAELARALALKLPDAESEQARQTLGELNGNGVGPSLSSPAIN